MNRRDLMMAAMAAGTGALAAPAGSLAQSEGVARPGPRNLITDVAGLKVGQAQDAAVRTGTTVILPDEAAVVAADVRGGGPATRETDATEPQNLVHAFDAVVLSGGSVYGLAAADGVVAWLGAHGRGYGLSPKPGTPKSPVIPSAALYDLANGGNKNWGLRPPYWDLGLAAAQAVSDRFDLGTAGAGYGAMAGSLKGGIGSASIVTADGFTVGALVAVNSAGSVVAPGTKQFWAAPFEIGREFGGLGTSQLHAGPDDWGRPKPHPGARENTTLAVVATDAKLTSDEAKRMAIMAQDGMARAIRPSHSPFDGDIVFAMATGKVDVPEPRAAITARLGALAADTLARAIARAVYEATPWPGSDVPTWKGL
ncbi:MAG TPA: P1 family peptidase [Caulobacteraceae bacterium]|nr:P1 family peptidase [Caulobacteraceae bacterium]